MLIRKLNPQGQTLDVLFSGAIPPNPAELLDGDGFSDVLNSLKAVMISLSLTQLRFYLLVTLLGC